MRKEDVMVDGEGWLVSLSKLTKKKIKDIHGYLSREFDDITFKLCWVIFEDGTRMNPDEDE